VAPVKVTEKKVVKKVKDKVEPKVEPPKKLEEVQPVAQALPEAPLQQKTFLGAELPPVSLKKGAGGMPLDPSFLGASQKKNMANAFKEFDDF